MKRFLSMLKLIGLYFRLNLSGALEYRFSFFATAAGMALSNSSFVFFWWVVFEKVSGQIGGYDFQDVMFIWAAASSAIGLAYVLFGNLTNISSLIVTGELDTFLLQPKDVLVNLLCARTNLSAWGDFAYGFILMALTNNQARSWAFFLLAVVIGALLMTAVATLAHSLSFYIGDAGSVGGLVTEFMLNFSLYPEGIFQGVARLLMMSVLPAWYIVHVPLKLARGASLWYLLLLLGFAFVFCSAAWWVFHRSLKRYESGNLIVTRM